MLRAPKVKIFCYRSSRCGHVYHSECMAGTTGTEGNWMCFLCNKTGLSRLSSWKGKKTVGKSVKSSPGAGQV